MADLQHPKLLGQLTALWAQALEIDTADVQSTSDFFDLGGHSLAAIRITAQVRDLVDPQVPLELIFDLPILSDYVVAVADYGKS